jgi:hypothetical protein
MADNDVLYHRIGRVGLPDAKLPRMTAAAELHAIRSETWAIVENSEIRATYPSSAVRLSIVWKGNIESEANPELLSLDRVMSICIADLRKREIGFRLPADPLADKTWMATLDSIHGTVPELETATEREDQGPNAICRREETSQR